MSNEQLGQPAGTRFFYGYIIVLLCFIIAAVVEGLLFSFAVFFKPLLTEFGWTRAMTSGAMAVAALFHAAFFPVAGRLTDKFGARWALSVSGFSLGLGCLLMSQASVIWHLYVFYGVLIGTGLSFYWVPVISILPRWFIKKRSLVMGIVACGIGFGQLIYGPTVNWLISAYGWRTSFTIVGSVSMGIIIISSHFLRREPEQKGLLPYGESSAQQVTRAEGFSIRQAVRTRQFWMYCGIFFSWDICFSVVLVHSVIHAIGLGMSPASAANILVIIGVTGIVGRLGFGHLADVIGMKSVVVSSFGLMLIAFVCLIVDSQMWMVYLFSALYGLSYGSFEILESPIIANLFGLQSLGTIVGVAAGIGGTGFILGSVVAGHVFDISGSYLVAFLMCAVASIFAGILSAFLPLKKQGE